MQHLISLFSWCTGWELVFLWQKHNHYRIRLLFDPVRVTYGVKLYIHKNFPGTFRLVDWKIQWRDRKMLHGGVFHCQNLQCFISPFLFFSNLAIFKRFDWAENRSYKCEIWHTSSTIVLLQNRVGNLLEFCLSFQIIGSNVISIRQKFIIKLQIAFILFWKLISKIPHTVLEVNVC